MSSIISCCLTRSFPVAQRAMPPRQDGLERFIYTGLRPAFFDAIRCFIRAAWSRVDNFPGLREGEIVPPPLNRGMNSNYKLIEGYPGYRISAEGAIESSWSRTSRPSRMTEEWRPLKPFLRCGYPAVNLSRSGKKKAFRIHQLVMRTYVGLCPEGFVVCHIDGNPANNSLSNLRYGTHQSNADDTLRHGTRCRGESLPHSKLKEAEVMEIRKLRAEGVPTRVLADRFGVVSRTIRVIFQRRSWRHLP